MRVVLEFKTDDEARRFMADCCAFRDVRRMEPEETLAVRITRAIQSVPSIERETGKEMAIRKMAQQVANGPQFHRAEISTRTIADPKEVKEI